MSVTEWKQDDRPKRHGWAPGEYMNKCHACGDGFIGDKRARTCADCAYAEPDHPMTAENKSLVERLREAAHDAEFEQVAPTVALLTEAVAEIERLEREKEETRAVNEQDRTTVADALDEAEIAHRLLDDLDHYAAQARSAADDENEACARVAELCDPTTYVASNIRARRKGEANVG